MNLKVGVYLGFLGCQAPLINQLSPRQWDFCFTARTGKKQQISSLKRPKLKRGLKGCWLHRFQEQDIYYSPVELTKLMFQF